MTLFRLPLSASNPAALIRQHQVLFMYKVQMVTKSPATRFLANTWPFLLEPEVEEI